MPGKVKYLLGRYLGEVLDPNTEIMDEDIAEYLAEHHGIRLTQDAQASMTDTYDPDEDGVDGENEDYNYEGEQDAPTVRDLLALEGDAYGDVTYTTGDPNRMYMIKVVDGPELYTFDPDADYDEPMLFRGDEIRIYDNKSKSEQVDSKIFVRGKYFLEQVELQGTFEDDGRLSKGESGVTRVLKNALILVPKKKAPAKEAKKTVQKKTAPAKKTKKTVPKKKTPLTVPKKKAPAKKTKKASGPSMPKGIQPGDICYMRKREGDPRRKIKGVMTYYKRDTWVKTPECLKKERNEKACNRTTKRQKEKNAKGRFIYKCYQNGDVKPDYMAKKKGEKFRRTTWLKHLTEVKSLSQAQCRHLRLAT